MKFKVKVELKKNIVGLLRDCGYRLHPKYEDSYIRPVTNSGFYPRWHLYLDNEDDIYTFKLHLDQKNVSYAGQIAHSGDYDDDLVKEEAKRIISLIVKYNK
jgi:hypothetical protein